MQGRTRIATALALVITVAATGLSFAQSFEARPPIEIDAVAIVRNQFGADADRVKIRVTRWSTEAEREQLVNTLQDKGANAALEELRGMKSVGSIRTPDSLAYDLHYAQVEVTEEGGRRIVLATDRPIGFWEFHLQSRTVNYPFTVIQMELDQDGEGEGTMSLAAKIIPAGDNRIVLEDFETAPVLLTQIQAAGARN
jgi:hypothetical protein